MPKMKTTKGLSQLYRDAMYYHLRKRGYNKTYSESMVNKAFNKVEVIHLI